MLLLAVFKYAQDSVLVVDRPAFDACNATEPLAAFTDGATTVRLDRPGFFCFISGEPGHCQEGQRLMVRVMVHPAGLAAAPAPGVLAQPGARPRSSSGCASSAAAEPVAAAAAGGVAVTAAMAGVLVGLF